jgi:hypothetical protein
LSPGLLANASGALLAPAVILKCKCLRVACQFFRKEFEADGAMQSIFLGLVNNTHPATAEFFHDAVMGNRLVERRLGIRHPARMLGSM